MPAPATGKVRVRVYVERTINERAIMFLDVDEKEDQWTTFDRAAAIADKDGGWTRLEVHLSRMRSYLEVVE